MKNPLITLIDKNFPGEITTTGMATFSNTRTKPKVAAVRGAAKTENICSIFRIFLL